MRHEQHEHEQHEHDESTQSTGTMSTPKPLNEVHTTALKTQVISGIAPATTEVMGTTEALDAEQTTSDVTKFLNKPGLMNDEEEMKELIQKHASEIAIQEDEDIQLKGKPKTVDIRVVMQMLQSIKLDLQQGNQAQSCEGHKQIRQMEDKLEEINKKYSMLVRDVEVGKAKHKMLAGTVSRMSQTIIELQNKLEIQEINAGKRSVILSGFEGSTKIKECKSQLHSFFEEVLGIEVTIEDLYFIGSQEPRDIVIIFLSSNHKRLIFQNIEKMKGYVNAHGKKYRFRDLLTQKQYEKQNQVKRITKWMEQQEAVDQKDVTTQKGKIYIGDQQYTKQVHPPDPTKVLQMPIENLNKVMSMKVDIGDETTVQGNSFQAFSACVDNYEQIQNIYMQIRLNNADARHIVCAWSIPGIKYYEANDGCDDEDHGMSAKILDLMLRNNITHRALYVVRHVGEKLNKNRISAYVEAASGVVEKYPYNPLTKKQQKIVEMYPTEDPQIKEKMTYAGAVKSPPKTLNPNNVANTRGKGRGNAQRGRPWNRKGGWKRGDNKREPAKKYIPRARGDTAHTTGTQPDEITEDMEQESAD